VNDEFDGWIERELHTAFAGLGDAIPEPAYRKAPRRGLRLRGVVPAVIGGKLATGIAITCMAAASSVAASAVVTGSPDPFTLIHNSAAPAASPDTTARPAAPGKGNDESAGGEAGNSASNGAHQGTSGAGPEHSLGGPDGGTAQGGGRSNGGSDMSGRAAGSTPATPPGHTGAPHGSDATTNGVGTGGGRGRSANGYPNKRY
jgi:hypothetical protein